VARTEGFPLNLKFILTRSERHHLNLIIDGRLAGLAPVVCERLVVLGLVRQEGDSYIATDDGRKFAKRA
jgi:hypothetical protein